MLVAGHSHGEEVEQRLIGHGSHEGHSHNDEEEDEHHHHGESNDKKVSGSQNKILQGDVFFSVVSHCDPLCLTTRVVN